MYGEIFGRAKRAPHWAVQLRFRMIYMYVGMSVCLGKPIQKLCMPKCVGGITWPKHAHAQSQIWEVKTDL